MISKFKKYICVLLCFITLISICSVSANAETNESSIDFANDEYNYYRNCDYDAGTILEKYDMLINGENEINYFDLATSMSVEKADRINAMNFIMSIYNLVDDSEKKILKSYIKNYAIYTNETNLLDFYTQISSVPQAISNSMYSAENAVSYANQYWNSYNPAYPNLNEIGGDCANFVSQCLLAGGKTMSGDWYIYQKNDTYMNPTTVNELNYSWDLSDPSPWISAEEFGNYWSENCTTYEYTLSNYENNHSAIFNSGNVKAGDALLLMKRVLWWYEGDHVMIIVDLDVENSDFIYAGHSNDRIDGTILGNICDSYSDSYKIKFFSM